MSLKIQTKFNEVKDFRLLDQISHIFLKIKLYYESVYNTINFDDTGS